MNGWSIYIIDTKSRLLLFRQVVQNWIKGRINPGESFLLELNQIELLQFKLLHFKIKNLSPNIQFASLNLVSCFPFQRTTFSKIGVEFGIQDWFSLNNRRWKKGRKKSLRKQPFNKVLFILPCQMPIKSGKDRGQSDGFCSDLYHFPMFQTFLDIGNVVIS